MAVSHILADKGRDIVSIARDQTMADAVAALSRHRIGAIIVLDASGALEGIVSERDVVRAMAERGADGLSDLVGDRMTRKVATCLPSATIPEVMEMMTTGRFRHVPVLEDGRVGGMVSIGDVVKHRLAEMEAEQQALRDYITTA